jgi:hypothetical protein
MFLQNIQSMFVNFNTTGGVTDPQQGDGCAFTNSQADCRVVLMTVISCAGLSMVFNAGTGQVEIEQSNFISCNVSEGGIISSNTTGIVVKYSIIRGDVPFFHAQSTAYGEPTAHQAIGCWFDVESLSVTLVSITLCYRGSTATYSLATRQSCEGSSCWPETVPPVKSATPTASNRPKTVTPVGTPNFPFDESPTLRISSGSVFFGVSFGFFSSARFSPSEIPERTFPFYESSGFRDSASFGVSFDFVSSVKFASLSSVLDSQEKFDSPEFGDLSGLFSASFLFQMDSFITFPFTSDKDDLNEETDGHLSIGIISGILSVIVVIVIAVILILIFRRLKRTESSEELGEPQSILNESLMITDDGMPQFLSVTKDNELMQAEILSTQDSLWDEYNSLHKV